MNKFMYCAKLKTGEIRYGVIEASSGLDCRRRLRPLQDISEKLDFIGLMKGENHAMIGQSRKGIDPPPLNPSDQLDPLFPNRVQ